MEEIKSKFQKRRDITVYVILRGLVILTLIMQIIHRNFENVFLCAFWQDFSKLYMNVFISKLVIIFSSIIFMNVLYKKTVAFATELWLFVSKILLIFCFCWIGVP